MLKEERIKTLLRVSRRSWKHSTAINISFFHLTLLRALCRSAFPPEPSTYASPTPNNMEPIKKCLLISGLVRSQIYHQHVDEFVFRSSSRGNSCRNTESALSKVHFDSMTSRRGLSCHCKGKIAEVEAGKCLKIKKMIQSRMASVLIATMRRVESN